LTVANAIYPSFKALALGLGIGVGTKPTGTLKMALIDTNDYTYSAAHDYWDDASAGVVGTPTAIGSPTTTSGTLDGADVTFSAVTGDPSEAVIVFLDTGTASTSPLVCYIDSGASGLPVTPNGGDITVTLNASGILSL